MRRNVLGGVTRGDRASTVLTCGGLGCAALAVGGFALAGCWSSTSSPPPPEPVHNAAPRTSTLAEAEPLPPRTVWRGFYDCRQGTTGVQLTIDVDADGRASAIFDFGAHAGNPDLPSGSYRLVGTFRETGGALGLDLTPEKWILQPPNYVMVGLQATADRARRRLDGRILADGCGKLSVRRFD